MGGRGTHVACTLTLTGLGHFGHHSRACTSTEKSSVGPEIYSDLGVLGLYMRTRSCSSAATCLALKQLHAFVLQLPELGFQLHKEHHVHSALVV